jgi:hypothetical protein
MFAIRTGTITKYDQQAFKFMSQEPSAEGKRTKTARTRVIRTQSAKARCRTRFVTFSRNSAKLLWLDRDLIRTRTRTRTRTNTNRDIHVCSFTFLCVNSCAGVREHEDELAIHHETLRTSRFIIGPAPTIHHARPSSTQPSLLSHRAQASPQGN